MISTKEKLRICKNKLKEELLKQTHNLLMPALLWRLQATISSQRITSKRAAKKRTTRKTCAIKKILIIPKLTMLTRDISLVMKKPKTMKKAAHSLQIMMRTKIVK